MGVLRGHHARPLVGRLVLVILAMVAFSFLRVQHYAVSSHRGAPSKGVHEVTSGGGSRRLSQRPEDPVDALVGLEAPVHGFVRKAGMTALFNWHPAYVPLRKAQFKAWLEQKGSVIKGGSPGLNLMGAKPPYILPFHDGRGCNIYYNERYRIIYLRTQKVASTTTMTFFGECKDAPDRPSCLRPLEVEDALQLQLMWRNYFVFGWTRNPWVRAVSSYQYLLHAVVDAPHCDQINWDAFCVDPLAFGDLCRDHPDCCPHFNHNFMWFHVNDQTTCLTTDSGEWAADFIGRSERFDEDFAAIVAEINRRLPPGVKPLLVAARPESQNTNEVSCSDELQVRQRTQGSAAAGAGEKTAAAEAAKPAADAAAAGGADQAKPAETAAATEPPKPAEAAAATELPKPAEAAAAATEPPKPAEAAAATEAAKPAQEAAGGAAAAAAQPQGQGQPAEAQAQAAAQQGSAAVQRRQLLYGKLPGFLFAEENYCDKRKFFTGRHAACFQQVARFYGTDMQRLGFGQLLSREEEAAAAQRR